MNAAELARYLDKASPALLDVREPWEFDICHIEGSINIPMGEITHRHHEFDPDTEIVVICHHGIRSMKVIWHLQQNDFSKLINLDGGVDAWAREVDVNLPVY